ncbi:MAG: pyrroline-5-carboxylate reductase [Rhodospirillales bacterium]|jgi:pyrroline-5-carboxylate reductase|nr:pyrroline-5-carboxylate reductase [Rhodospirillales bacterium]
MTGRIVLVGCGNMGHALLGGWCDRRAGVTGAPEIVVVEPEAERRHRAGDHFAVATLAGPASLPEPDPADVVVIAVKPQATATVVPAYAAHARAGALILSIAAGRTLASLESRLGGGAVVRAMPNTAAAVRAAITVACANSNVTAAQRTRAEDLLSVVGDVAWIEDEALLDAVTAVSGSGPAYVFLLTECLTDAAIAAGLPPPLATQLARATVVGAGRLLAATEAPAASLRREVTSPGGTTAAALAILGGTRGLAELMTAAVAAAADRSRELAREG